MPIGISTCLWAAVHLGYKEISSATLVLWELLRRVSAGLSLPRRWIYRKFGSFHMKSLGCPLCMATSGLGGAVSLKKHSLLGNSLHCQARLSRPNLRTLAKWCGQTPVNALRRLPLCRDNSHLLPHKHPRVHLRRHLTLNNNPNLPTTTSSPPAFSLPTVWMIFATVDRE